MYEHRFKSKFSNTGTSLLNSTTTVNSKPFNFRSRTHKDLHQGKSKTDYSKYSYHHKEKEIEDDLNHINMKLSRKFDSQLTGNNDKWNFDIKKTKKGKSKSYKFFEEVTDETNKKSSFLGKFKKGLNREKNAIDKKIDQKKNSNKKKKRRRKQVKDVVDHEEEIVGKKDYTKNMNLELEAQDAEFEKLIECNQCGRSFGRKGYQKHAKVCRKVFKKKKKNDENLKKNDKFEMKKNWKKQSEAFRDMLKANRKGGGKKGKKKQNSSEKKMGKKGSKGNKNKYDTFLQEGKKECEICKKLFSEQGLLRHIPLCQSKQKFNGGKGGFQRRRRR